MSSESKKLVELMCKLRKETAGLKAIDVTKDDNGLEISIDTGAGLDGLERAVADIGDSRYHLRYTGFAKLAFETFLEQSYASDIRVSEALTEFRDKTEALRYSRPNAMEGDYEQYLAYEHQHMEYGEVEHAMKFFARVFKDKSGHLREAQ